MRCAYCALLASILRPPILSSAVSDSALSRATVGDTAGHGHRLVLIFGNERAIVHALGAVSDHVLRLTVQAVKILGSRIHADMKDRKTLGLDALHELTLRPVRNDLIVRIGHRDHALTRPLLHGTDMVNRIIPSLIFRNILE